MSPNTEERESVAQAERAASGRSTIDNVRPAPRAIVRPLRPRRPGRVGREWRPLRVWLDLANSPHPVLLGPIADELEQAGHEIWVTARDHAQTADLALSRWPAAAVIGGPSPRSRTKKAENIMERVRWLHREAARRKPDVALSVNSYAQVIAARTAGVPSVTLMDYEFQPANHVSFRLAQRVIVPAAFPRERLRRYGARSSGRVCLLHGYKEELYIDRPSDLAPGGDGWSSVPGAGDAIRCLFRPAPLGASYHRGYNSRFDALLANAARRSDTCVLILPRLPQQREAYGSLPGVIVAEETVDGLRALLGADVFIGAGGTMCREAALLGVPAHTVFAGKLAAVDAQLMTAGLLRDLRFPSLHFDVWTKRDPKASLLDWERIRNRASLLRRSVISVVEDTAAMRSGTPHRASVALGS
jgi:predicted glycosyltransferase